jgi:fused signal recognition particle receptor
MFGRLFGKDEDQVSAIATPADAVDAEVLDQPAPAPVPVEMEAEPVPAAEAEPKSWFQRLRGGLAKTSSQLSQGITSVFTKSKLDASTLEELEDLLIQADLGVDTAMRITDRLSKERYNKEISADEIKQVLAEEVEAVLKPIATPLLVDEAHKPHIILVVGVNGTGKTTTIGKLARVFTQQGKSVMLAAGDTFRAAAVEQLKIWGERTGSPVVARETGADAAGLAYDALKQAREGDHEILIIDTAGRLQNKANLMAELEKIVRVIKKLDETAPHTVLLTLDATTGQNALNQVEIFRKTAGVTGLIMTKLDGTARGGILVAIADKYKLPVHAIGVGEGAEDFQPFDARDFARAIAGL